MSTVKQLALHSSVQPYDLISTTFDVRFHTLGLMKWSTP